MINQIVLNGFSPYVKSFIYQDSDKPINVIITQDADAITSLGAMRYKYENVNLVGFWYMPNHKEKETVHKLYLKEGLNEIPDDTIFLDLDVFKIDGKFYRCIGNHVTELSDDDIRNPYACNINSVFGINREKYRKKYNLGTVHLLYGLYDIPLPENKSGQALLCKVDSPTSSYFHKNEEFKMNCVGWLDLLGIGELSDFMARNSDKQYDFEVLADRLNLYENIRVNEAGKLETNMKLATMSKLLDLDLSLPSDKFVLHKEFKQKVLKLGLIPKTKRKDTATGAVVASLTYCYSAEINCKNSIEKSDN